MSSDTQPTRPFGLLVYRRGELGRTEILVRVKDDGMPTIPNILLSPGEGYTDAAARVAAGELGVRPHELLVNPRATGTSDHPDFRYVMMVASPRTELFARLTRSGSQPRWRWEALSALDKVAVHPQLRASGNALAFAIRCMDEPSVVLDPRRVRGGRESRGSGIFSSFSCFS
ncbi:hypothetical protein F5X96DRAFT_685681 [Biscogniauxia mediterranea]|nr:hypothetical protein F5X96DRAFT_685681 [Biscogniauxia mediterranea]